MEKELLKLSIDELTPYENNPRFNNDAVDAVAESIKQCEYIAPIIIDEDNIILAGHTRLKALRRLGKDQVDVLRVSGLTEEQKKKYRLLDNKTNEFADWDFETLDKELAELDFDGFDFFNPINFDSEVSYIDDLLSTPFSEKNDDSEFFSATFLLSNSIRENFEKYVKTNGKGEISNMIKEFILKKEE